MAVKSASFHHISTPYDSGELIKDFWSEYLLLPVVRNKLFRQPNPFNQFEGQAILI